MTKFPENKRKNPTQKRAQDTVELIFEATAQLLEEEKGHKISTNKIAKKAGFSIGTLYQYFPNIDSLIVSMAFRERERVKVLIEDIFAGVGEKTSEEVIREIVRTLFGAFRGRRKLRKHLIMAVFRTGHFKPFMQAQDDIVYMIIGKIEELNRPDIRKLDDTGSYVMSRALMGVIRSAVLEDFSGWDDPAFENEIVRMIYQYLRVAENDDHALPA